MAVLFLDDKMKELFPDAYNRIFSDIGEYEESYINNIKVIKFESDKYGVNEFVMARLHNNGHIHISNEPRFLTQ